MTGTSTRTTTVVVVLVGLDAVTETLRRKPGYPAGSAGQLASRSRGTRSYDKLRARSRHW
jgi:hypothetical protein